MDIKYNELEDRFYINMNYAESKRYKSNIQKSMWDFSFNCEDKKWKSRKTEDMNKISIKELGNLGKYNWMQFMDEPCKAKITELLEKIEEKEKEVFIFYDDNNQYFIMKCSYENRKVATDNNFKWNNDKKFWYSVNLKDIEPLFEYMDEATKSKIEEFREIEKSIQLREEVTKLVNRKNENLKLNGFPLISKIEISKEDTLEKAEDKIHIEAFYTIGLFIRDKINEDGIHHLPIDEKIDFLEKYQFNLLNNFKNITDKNEKSKIKDDFHIMISEVFPDGDKEDIKEFTKLYLENKKIDKQGILFQNLNKDDENEDLWKNPWAQ